MTGGAARAFATREACVRSGCTGGASTDASARTEGQFLQRFYEPYELTFFTRQPGAPMLMAFLGGFDWERMNVRRSAKRRSPVALSSAACCAGVGF